MGVINISPTRFTKDAQTVWHEPGPDVDLVMDPRQLTFRPGSLDIIISNKVIDQMFLDEGIEALKNWRNCLKDGGRLYVLADNFEYIARAFVSGEISLEMFNRHHNHASQWDRNSLGEALIKHGFNQDNVKIWFEGIKDVVACKHYEVLIEAIK